MRDGKAIGKNGMSNKVWKYGGRRKLRRWGLCNRVWTRERGGQKSERR